jgi:hypothetical protein
MMMGVRHVRRAMIVLCDEKEAAVGVVAQSTLAAAADAAPPYRAAWAPGRVAREG